jgi:uncharacterized membrane-anchored protein
MTISVRGSVRLDRRTKRLAERLRPGEIAVIDHEDIDSVAAEMLIEKGARAVVNARASISGRYPNLGPGKLLGAGIPIVDNVGPQVFELLSEGDAVELRGGEVRLKQSRRCWKSRRETWTPSSPDSLRTRSAMC